MMETYPGKYGEEGLMQCEETIFVLKLKCLLILLVFTASCKTGAIVWPQKDAEVAELKVDALFNLLCQNKNLLLQFMAELLQTLQDNEKVTQSLLYFHQR